MTTAQAAVYLVRPMTSYRLLAIGGDARTVGLVAAAFALLPLFLAIPLGRFADRHGGPLLALGCAVQVVACVGLALADTVAGLAAASGVLGLGHLGLALGVQAVIARESEERRHDAHFGMMAAGISLGQLVGPLLSGLLVGSGTPTVGETGRAMLAGATIAGGATAFALLAERHAAYTAAAHAAPRGSIRMLARTRGVPAGIFASIAVLTAADVFTAYLPVLGEERGIEPAAVGVLLALRAAASIGSRLGIGPIVERVGRLRLMTMSALSAAAALAGVGVSDSVVVLAVFSLVAGFGLGFGQPLSMTIVVQRVPEHTRATALALRLTGNRLGQVAVPAAAGLVAGSAGVGAVFWLLGGILVASALAVRRPAHERPRVDEPRPAETTVDS